MHNRMKSSSLTARFQDYLSLMDEVVEAYENFHLDAIEFTLDSIGDFGGPLVARVVWRSPLLKVGKGKTVDGLHMTLMDANGVEITGTAWGAIAAMYNNILVSGKIYKFQLVVRHLRQTGTFRSRLLDQPIVLRFSGLTLPEEVRQSPYPDIDYKQLTADYGSLRCGEVRSIVGFVTAIAVSTTDPHVMLSNGYGECVKVNLSQEKLEEAIGALEIIPLYTVLGIHGVARVRMTRSNAGIDELPNSMLFKSHRELSNPILFDSYEDTLLVTDPACEDSKWLIIWRNIWSTLIYIHVSSYQQVHRLEDNFGFD